MAAKKKPVAKEKPKPKPKAPVAIFTADRNARRLPQFVIEQTGLKTLKQVVAKYGEGATFKSKHPPVEEVSEPEEVREPSPTKCDTAFAWDGDACKEAALWQVVSVPLDAFRGRVFLRLCAAHALEDFAGATDSLREFGDEADRYTYTNLSR